jgi:hypothetical protein
VSSRAPLGNRDRAAAVCRRAGPRRPQGTTPPSPTKTLPKTSNTAPGCVRGCSPQTGSARFWVPSPSIATAEGNPFSLPYAYAKTGLSATATPTPWPTLMAATRPRTSNCTPRRSDAAAMVLPRSRPPGRGGVAALTPQVAARRSPTRRKSGSHAYIPPKACPTHNLALLTSGKCPICG